MNFPKRFSIAVALPRDGSEPLCLGIHTKQSALLPLLDQCDPKEIAIVGIVKDVQFTTKKTLVVDAAPAAPEVPPVPPVPPGGPKVKLEDFTDEEPQTLVAPEYKVDPTGKSREELIAAIKAAAAAPDGPA